LRPANLHELGTSVTTTGDCSHFLEVDVRGKGSPVAIVISSSIDGTGIDHIVSGESIFNGGAPLFLLIKGLVGRAEVDLEEGLQLLVEIEVNVLRVLVHSQPLGFFAQIKHFSHLTD
jgi:hypothetical protein